MGRVGGGDLVDAAELGHDSVEEEEIVRTDPNSRPEEGNYFIISSDLSLPGKERVLPAEMNTLEPVENVHAVLHVHHPHEAGEDAEDGGLGGPEGVDEHDWFIQDSEARDTVDQVDTVGDRDTEVGPVGTEDHLDGVLGVLQLQL